MNKSVKIHGINGVKIGNMCQTGVSHLKTKPGSSQIDVISITASFSLFTFEAVNAKLQANTLLKYSVIIIRKRFYVYAPTIKKESKM
jgi:hypothetical protein